MIPEFLWFSKLLVVFLCLSNQFLESVLLWCVSVERNLLVAHGLVTLFACPPTKSGFPGHCLGSGAPEPRWQLFLFVRARVPVNGARPPVAFLAQEAFAAENR